MVDAERSQAYANVRTSAWGVLSPERRPLQRGAMTMAGAFEADRAMFASGYPLGRLEPTFHELYPSFGESAAECSVSERKSVIYDTTTRSTHSPSRRENHDISSVTMLNEEQQWKSRGR
jgi:hypothetical protein